MKSDGRWRRGALAPREVAFAAIITVEFLPNLRRREFLRIDSSCPATVLLQGFPVHRG